MVRPLDMNYTSSDEEFQKQEFSVHEDERSEEGTNLLSGNVNEMIEQAKLMFIFPKTQTLIRSKYILSHNLFSSNVCFLIRRCRSVTNPISQLIIMSTKHLGIIIGTLVMQPAN